MASQPLNFLLPRVCAAAVLLTSAIGCDNSGDAGELGELNTFSDSPEPVSLPTPTPVEMIDGVEALTGTFIDGTIEGLSFETETQRGVTNNRGEYSYLAGETITFYIGALQLPTIEAAEAVTPFQLAMGSANPFPATLNIARLLQSLDSDGIPENGIRIAAEAAFVAAPVNFDVSPVEFENNPNVINLVANSGSVTTVLIRSIDMDALFKPKER